MSKLMLVNPRKRKKATSPARKVATRKKPSTQRKRPVRRKATTVRRRRNPISARRNIMQNQITPAFTAAGGALGLDVAWAMLPIPEGIKTGAFRHVAKGAGAIVLGALASNILGRKTGEQMATGALTVVMHGAMREVAQNAMPNLQLGFYNAGYNAGVGEYVNGMGAYIPDSDENTYLSDSLATPFKGRSSAQAIEARMVQECEANR